MSRGSLVASAIFLLMAELACSQPSAAGLVTTTGGSGTTGAPMGSTSSSTGDYTGPCVWVGDVCVLEDCSNAPIATPCVLDGGGLGGCHNRSCSNADLQNDPSNCGNYGAVCPTGVTCQFGVCGDAFQPFDCSDGGGCPVGYLCGQLGGPTGEFGSWSRGGFNCIAIDCSLASPDDYCRSADGRHVGFCCGGSCLSNAQVYVFDPGDPNNCGGCGVRCDAGSVCQSNACVPAGDCTPGSYSEESCALPNGAYGTCCGGLCVDYWSDPAHCGDCSSACADGGTCRNATCSTNCETDADCSPGYACGDVGLCFLSTCDAENEGNRCLNVDAGLGMCCGGNWTDVITNENCGSCGVTCPSGATCVASPLPWLFGVVCVVPPACLVDGDWCRLDGGDGTCCAGRCSPCPVCGLLCPLGSNCQVRDCAGCPECRPGVFACNPECVNAKGDEVFCLANDDCPNGSVCASGSCVLPSCDGGNTICALSNDAGVGTCCGSSCLDLTTDTANCGGCGTPCPTGRSCFESFCVDSDGGYGGCTVVGCPAGFLCPLVDGACIPATCDSRLEGDFCALGPGRVGACCNGACVDLTEDPLDCGLCGLTCPSGYCAERACVEQPVPQNCLQTCGSGTVCAGTDCVGSSCGPNGTWPYHCLAKDGTVGTCCGPGCAHLDDDPQNCGGCGIQCPSSTVCQNGLCHGVTACGPGHASSYCDLDAGLSFLCCPGVGCIDTSADSNNCGACGVSCSTGQSCDAGVCG